MKRGQSEENLELSPCPAGQCHAGGGPGVAGRGRNGVCCQPGHVQGHMCGSHVETQIPAGAGGGAQAGSARAADGEEAGTSSVLSLLGAASPPDFSSVKKKGKNSPLHLLASELLPVFPCQGTDPRSHLCPPQLCLHICSYSCPVL